jgi:signal transduction histidine kinase
VDAPFLCGVLSAWAAAQIALGLFFVISFAFARGADDYRLFGLLCFPLAIATIGMAWGHTIEDPVEWRGPGTLAHAGASVAAAVNLHFVMRFVGTPRARTIASAAYAVTGVFAVLLLFGALWSESSGVRSGVVLGRLIQHVTVESSTIGLLHYLFNGLQVLAAEALLVQAYLRGKRELLASCGTGLVVLIAALNDMLLVNGKLDDTIYLVPHAFMLYAIGVASTLLLRYRLATGELEQVESTLRETTEELRHSHAELRVLQDELVYKRELARVGELAAAIAHEVRNPLAIIVNAVASLRRSGIGSEDRRMLLGIVDEETARLSRLVDDLLRFARPVNVQVGSVALAELAERSGQRVAGDHEVEVAVEPDAPASIPADEHLLRIALDNLVENARHATPAGGSIAIVVGRGELDGGACARIDVRDTGSGMNDDVLARATDPFFTTRPSGTGLGLPIVQRIAEAHGGRLELASHPGSGTTASLLLPDPSRSSSAEVA